MMTRPATGAVEGPFSFGVSVSHNLRISLTRLVLDSRSFEEYHLLWRTSGRRDHGDSASPDEHLY
jgi:hypothetical protein